MLFSLEALQANQGDCLILHFGEAKSPQFAVIDGGPATIYKNVLKKRLAQLASKFGKEDTLPIALAMVSHIDSDHITGILDWLVDEGKSSGTKCQIGDFWFNSFSDALNHIPQELRTVSLGDTPAMQIASIGKAGGDGHLGMIVASVDQGRRLRDFLDQKNIQVNGGRNGLLIAKGKSTAGVFDDLKLTVVSPNDSLLKGLYDEWQKELKKPKAKMNTAAYVDRSVTNLSSIVVVAEYKGHKMLLTGDARGDHILAGLRGAKFLENRPLHVDLLKVPHHGSSRDLELEFFKSVTADNYVISADGEYDNPDLDVLCWIAEARGNDDYTLHLTNEKSPRWPALEKNLTDAFRKFPALQKKTRFRSDKALSICVDVLGDKVGY
jgi:hypothetical protein